jgi:hypothetical protein
MIWRIYNCNWVDTRWQQYSTHLVDTRWQQYSTHLHTKVKQSHYRSWQALRVPGVWVPRFQDNRHMKVSRLSALRTGRLYPKELFLVLISATCWVDPRARVRPEGMKNSNDTIENQTQGLPVGSTVPQPTAPPRATHLHLHTNSTKNKRCCTL